MKKILTSEEVKTLYQDSFAMMQPQEGYWVKTWANEDGKIVVEVQQPDGTYKRDYERARNIFGDRAATEEYSP